MKLSIITPVLNQAKYIRKTIESVYNQQYNEYEHIVIDGGSTDGTIEILKEYNHLKWISEKDSGQANAINKGFEIATGDFGAWLNADDYYAPECFEIVMKAFTENQESEILYGDITYVNEKDEILDEVSGGELTYSTLINDPDLVRQPSTFWSMRLWREIGGLDESLDLVFDLDFFLKAFGKTNVIYVPQTLSFYREYITTKTNKFKRKQVIEIIKTVWQHKKFVSLRTFMKLFNRWLFK